jgi:ribosomal protein S18 acetylase RimI-like enzyme
MITLKKAGRADLMEIHRIQVASFQALLDKYQDYGTNPAAERFERILERFQEKTTDYYLICLNEQNIGMVRVCDFGTMCRVSPIGILPEFQGRGFAQQVMVLLENRYLGAEKWTLDTIRQEQKLCYLYEKLGYVATGKQETIQPGMDIVFYEKNV